MMNKIQQIIVPGVKVFPYKSNNKSPSPAIENPYPKEMNHT